MKKLNPHIPPDDPRAIAHKKGLKLFNGRWTTKRDSDSHIFVCAKSKADAQRLCAEAGFKVPMSEISQYWSCGGWGNSMDGVEPERGIWVQMGTNYPMPKPRRII